jgi:hypothetical protein
MRDSLTNRSVGKTDTLVVLQDHELSFQTDLRVAHISACGWIDFFHARVHIDIPEENFTRHLSLTPSMVVELKRAMAAHPSLSLVPTCGHGSE